MKWYIVTCDASAHIRPVQEWLFKKYAPEVEVNYLNVGSKSVSTWGKNVLTILPKEGDYVVFGLDDYLPTSRFDERPFNFAFNIMRAENLDRFELGYGAHNKENMMNRGTWLYYGSMASYSVSCQFSIWKLSTLRRVLTDTNTPWNFETKHKVWAGCFPKGQEAFRWIEESALSKRWKGQINVNGLNPGDVNELIALGLLDESKLINRG